MKILYEIIGVIYYIGFILGIGLIISKILMPIPWNWWIITSLITIPVTLIYIVMILDGSMKEIYTFFEKIMINNDTRN